MANLVNSIETVSDAISTVNQYDNGQLGIVYSSSNKEYLYSVTGDIEEVVSTINYNNEMVQANRNDNNYSVGRAVHNYRKEGVIVEL